MIMHGVYGNNITEIRKARPSSDVYALVERTAYFLFDLKYSSDDIKNWFDAQKKIARWSKCKPPFDEKGNKNPMYFPEDLELYIAQREKEFDARYGRNSGNKERALDEIANEVIGS